MEKPKIAEIKRQFTYIDYAVLVDGSGGKQDGTLAEGAKINLEPIIANIHWSLGSKQIVRVDQRPRVDRSKQQLPSRFFFQLVHNSTAIETRWDHCWNFLSGYITEFRSYLLYIIGLNHVVDVVLSSRTFTALTTSRHENQLIFVFHLSSVYCSNLRCWLAITVPVQDTRYITTTKTKTDFMPTHLYSNLITSCFKDMLNKGNNDDGHTLFAVFCRISISADTSRFAPQINTWSIVALVLIPLAVTMFRSRAKVENIGSRSHSYRLQSLSI